ILLSEANNRFLKSYSLLVYSSLIEVYKLQASKATLARRAKGKLYNPGTIRALVHRNYSYYIEVVDDNKDNKNRKRILCAHENYVGHTCVGPVHGPQRTCARNYYTALR
ncbi:hypothetical protein GE21DRAFT_1219412, partial [Neurospora crassa]